MMGIKEYYWMWGLYYNKIPGFSTTTTLLPLEEPAQYMIPIFLSGIFSAIIIFFCSLIPIGEANRLKKNRKDSKNIGIRLIGEGILILIAIIVYVIAIEITTTNYTEFIFSDLYDDDYISLFRYEFEFWDIYDPGFAIIGPIIGASLNIIAGGVIIYLNSRENVM
ncbi:MAG: hypothetical protein ACFFCE_09315 [Promethearchaeota archaeon]